MIADSLFILAVISVWLVIARGCAYILRERSERRKVDKLVRKYWDR